MWNLKTFGKTNFDTSNEFLKYICTVNDQQNMNTHFGHSANSKKGNRKRSNHFDFRKN